MTSPVCQKIKKERGHTKVLGGSESMAVMDGGGDYRRRWGRELMRGSVSDEKVSVRGVWLREPPSFQFQLPFWPNETWKHRSPREGAAGGRRCTSAPASLSVCPEQLRLYKNKKKHLQAILTSQSLLSI